MPRIVPTTCFCLLACLSMAQIDSSSLDSLSRRIDSSTRAYRSHNDSTARAIDSLTRKALEYNDSVMRAQSMAQMDRNRDYFMADIRKRQEEKERRDAFRNLAIGIGFGALLVFGLLRRKKQKKDEESRGGKV